MADRGVTVKPGDIILLSNPLVRTLIQAARSSEDRVLITAIETTEPEDGKQPEIRLSVERVAR